MVGEPSHVTYLNLPYVHFSTSRWLLLAALYCVTPSLLLAQLPLSAYLEPECFDLSGTNFFVATDALASNGRYVAYQVPPPGQEPQLRTFRRTLDFGRGPELDIPFIELLSLNVYGRLRATEASKSYLEVRVNEGEWFTFEGSIAPTDDFEWIAAPNRLTGLRSGINTFDIRIRQRGTQLDKIFVTLTGEVPTGPGDEAINCEGIDFEPAPIAEYWLEAECATVGAAWETIVTDRAAADQAVSATASSRPSPPADVAASRVRFTLENPTGGDYSLFARVNAPSGQSDSYWVRVNDGEWYPWSRGFRQGQGFRWKRYPDGPVSLQAGTNTIDFAFREAGTQLDKLHLNTTGIRPPVTDFGATGTNCDAVAPPTFAFEAECAVRGAGWVPLTSSTASNDKAMVFLGPNSLAEPTGELNDRALVFAFNVPAPTTYYGFLRLDAPSLGSNSFWVRIDGSDWIKLWKEADGSPLRTDGLEWRALTDDGQPVSFDLTAGPHTVTVVNRESGTRLDKLILSASDVLPTGLGAPAAGCTTRPPVIPFPQTPAPAAYSAPAAAEVAVYPNPATTELTLELTTAYVGRVTVRVVDGMGRAVRQLVVEKAVGELRAGIDVGDLPGGVYRLQVLQGQETTVVPFLKQ